MIYIIDHLDSFTWNVVHQFSEFDKVHCSNYTNLNKRLLDKSKIIVLSPGPGSPKDYPLTSEIYKKYKGKKKIIGICLGFQQILYCEKADIVQQKRIFHGHQSSVTVTNKKSLFKKNIKITMRCNTTGIAMALENKKDNVYGFQFHPDSFLTINGKILIKKIISA